MGAGAKEELAVEACSAFNLICSNRCTIFLSAKFGVACAQELGARQVGHLNIVLLYMSEEEEEDVATAVTVFGVFDREGGGGGGGNNAAEINEKGYVVAAAEEEETGEKSDHWANWIMQL